MSDGSGKKLDFPWEKARSGHADKPDAGNGPAPGKEEENKKKPAFPGETTSEYNVDEAFQKAAARSEISMDSPEAVEDTRELAVPERVRSPRRDPAVADEIRAQWETQPRVVSRFKRWWYSDPAVQWFCYLPRKTRVIIVRSIWILAASSAIVGVFSASALGIYPWMESVVRPTFAPKPKEPVRFYPRGQLPLDFVEDRTLRAQDFKMGLESIWITANPLTGWTIDRNRLELVDLEGPLASLDLRDNWDGLMRVYFGAGKVPVAKPLYIRIPIVGGGMWTVAESPSHRRLTAGGTVPPFYLLGPITFRE